MHVVCFAVGQNMHHAFENLLLQFIMLYIVRTSIALHVCLVQCPTRLEGTFRFHARGQDELLRRMKRTSSYSNGG